MEKLMIDVIFGALPEVLFYTFFLIHIKELKTKRTIFLIAIFISYSIFCYGIPYKTESYIGLTLSIFACLYFFYPKKTQLMDIFLVFIAIIYIMFTQFVSFLPFGNRQEFYYIAYGISRVLLFLPFIFYKQFPKIYRLYCSGWNRKENKNKHVKSLTLRTISVIFLNVCIFAMYVFILVIIQ